MRGVTGPLSPPTELVDGDGPDAQATSPTSLVDDRTALLVTRRRRVPGRGNKRDSAGGELADVTELQARGFMPSSLIVVSGSYRRLRRDPVSLPPALGPSDKRRLQVGLAKKAARVTHRFARENGCRVTRG